METKTNYTPKQQNQVIDDQAYYLMENDMVAIVRTEKDGRFYPAIGNHLLSSHGKNTQKEALDAWGKLPWEEMIAIAYIFNNNKKTKK